MTIYLWMSVLGSTSIWFVYHLLDSLDLWSPLSRLPAAHWSVRITSRWFKRACASNGELKTLHATHQVLGPIVRIGPREVSVVSEEGLAKVYTSGLDKSEWYAQAFPIYGMPNLVSTLSHKTHASMRRMIAGSYGRSHLQHAEQLQAISARIIQDGLLPNLHRRVQSAEPTNVMELSECLAMDFITGHIFGDTAGTDFLNENSHCKPYIYEWRRASGSFAKRPLTEALVLEKCRMVISNYECSRDKREYQRSVVIQLYKGLSDYAEQGRLNTTEVIPRCASEMADHVIATLATVPVILTYLFYQLCRRGELQDSLRAELRTLTSPAVGHDDVTVLSEPAILDELPLLDALVMETLRLHAPNPARLRRVVPSAGLNLHGYFIPPDTIISSNAYCLHRNEEVFARPFEWDPTKWRQLENSEPQSTDTSKLRKMRKWLWAFGSGPRICVGQHLALQSRSRAQ